MNDFKTAWTAYNKKLSDNLRLNEALLRKANLKASKQELQKPLYYEIASLILFIVLLPVFFILSFNYINDIKFLITGLVLCVAFIIGLILCIKKLNCFYSIDYYGSPVIKLQEQLARLKTVILKARKIELYALVPCSLISGLILMMKIKHGVDVFAEFPFFFVYIFVALLFTYIGVWLLNKFLYDKKIKNAEELFNELTAYQKEDATLQI